MDTTAAITVKFDSSNAFWSGKESFNLFFLQAQQNYMNDVLKFESALTLNKVLFALGIGRVAEGDEVGWTLNHGDEYVSFGLEPAIVGLNQKSIKLTFNATTLPK